MSQNILISTDKATLLSQISPEELNARLQNDLRVFWQNYTSEYSISDGVIHIPLFILKRSLLHLAGFFKKNDVRITFDDFTGSIFNSFLKDRKCFKNQSSGREFSGDNIVNELIKAGFKRTLKDEQMRDTLLLTKLCHGANFSVPGAGKTTTLLAVHSILRNFGVVNSLFVVAPINAFISWEDEVEEIFKTNRKKIVRITKEYITNYQKLKIEEADILLMNYEKFRSDIGVLRKYFVENKIHFVLDESHRIKSGINNLRYRNIIELADVSVRRDIMSGTPMPQVYLDLLPQLDLYGPVKAYYQQILMTRQKLTKLRVY